MGQNETMNHMIRNAIHKNPIIYKTCLWIVRTYGKIKYGRLDKKYTYKKRLQALKNKKQGTCIIVGNGPSVKIEDLEKLSEFDCFATNKIYKLFSQTKWRPNYYVVFDWSGMDDEDQNNIDDCEMAFLGDHFYRMHHIHKNNAIVVYGNRLLDTKLKSFLFSDDISEGVYCGATVSYVCIQLAIYMGYDRIVLYGFDHNYAYIIDNKGNIIKNPNVEETHFYKEDSSKAYADIEGINNAYIAADRYAKERSVSIVNATRGGSLELFKRIDIDNIIDEVKVIS